MVCVMARDLLSRNILDGTQRHHSLLRSPTDRGVNCNITIQEIIEILLTIQTFIFFTKYKQFHYVNDTKLKR